MQGQNHFKIRGKNVTAQVERGIDIINSAKLNPVRDIMQQASSTVSPEKERQEIYGPAKELYRRVGDRGNGKNQV